MAWVMCLLCSVPQLMTPHFGCLTTSCQAQEIPSLVLRHQQSTEICSLNEEDWYCQCGELELFSGHKIIVYNLVPRSWSVCLSLSSLLQALCFTSAHFSPPPGLTLSVSAVAAVSDDISISVNWLLDLQHGDLNCKLTTGDGHIIYLHSPEGWVASCADRLTVSD